jgi:hypothetical protein
MWTKQGRRQEHMEREWVRRLQEREVRLGLELHSREEL